MPLKTTSLEAVPTIGIDIGRNTFHLKALGLNKLGMAANFNPGCSAPAQSVQVSDFARQQNSSRRLGRSPWRS